MRRVSVMGWVLGVLAAVGAALGARSAGAVDRSLPVSDEYRYRTGKMVEPPPDKRLWDYLSFFAVSVEPEPGHEFPAAEAEELKARARELVRQLVANGPEGIADEYVLTVNTFVNLNHLYKTSSLGRYLGEQVIGELQAVGVGVIDVRKTTGLLIREGYGEYGLSRDMAELRARHAAQAEVVGTYTYADGQILVNARLLRNSDGLVLSHANLTFALDGLSRQLLQDEAAPPRRGGLVKIEAGH